MRSIYCPIAQLLAATVAMPLALAQSQQCCYGDGTPCVCGSQGCSPTYCSGCCYGDGTPCLCGSQGCSSTFCAPTPSPTPQCCLGDGTPCVCGSQGCSTSYCTPTPAPTPQCCLGDGRPCVCGSQGCSTSYCTPQCCYGNGQTCSLLQPNNVCPQSQGCSPTFCTLPPIPDRDICDIRYTGQSARSNECCTCLYGSGSTCIFDATCMECTRTCVQFQFIAVPMTQTSSAEEEGIPEGYEFHALAPEEASKVLTAFFCPVNDNRTQAVSVNFPEAAMVTLDADGDGNITCSEYTKSAPQLLETIQISTQVPKAGDGTGGGSSTATGLAARVDIWMAMVVAGVVLSKLI